ncbi:hypothetical protein AALP_AA1G086100 [Arabis alpina]|uniref:AB hydrolase-1 domain-containing protein n=1 Tax=Arabis alpina TaxID=50452 RepID=A0A087HLZ6_ARAAL|nr:hypothetical protein AALP_AA1G086100 [Arabis alpina]
MFLQDFVTVMGDSSANSKRVMLQDGRFLAYREIGVPKEEAKYKIILVHGFGSSKSTSFSASKDLIEELGVYFLLYDRSGYGESDSNTKHSLKSEVDDIADLADQLSGVVFISPTVNYQWPSLPEELIKKDYRRFLIKWTLVFYFNSHDMEVLKRPTGFPMATSSKDKLRDNIVYDTLRDDLAACFEQWDFEPADISITEESFVHIWHGNKDLVIPVQLQRCILEKQPLINYHEVPNGGHMIKDDSNICDAVLRALLHRG